MKNVKQQNSKHVKNGRHAKTKMRAADTFFSKKVNNLRINKLT